MYKRILIPLDISPTDETILKHIVPLIKLTHAHVILVHVADGFAARLQSELDLADSEEIQTDETYLEKKRKDLEKHGISTKAVLLQGKEPADSILAMAKQEKCDLIAMATHGHGFVKDMILGSVADQLRHRTDIPILMIRDPAKK